MTQKTAFAPTAEQQHALALFATGKSLAIEAGAGTGKTSTLKLLAESTPRRGQYVAFNKAIVEEAKAKMPSTVSASTAHSLAYRNIVVRHDWMGGRLRHSARMKSTEIASRLRIEQINLTLQDDTFKRLHASYLAGVTMRAIIRFCQTADAEPSWRHVPYIDGIDLPPGARTNNEVVAKALEGPMRKAWADITNSEGSLPFRHDHYLKCQPPETLVRKTDGTSIAIDEIKVGDQVMTWNGDRRLGHIRRTGRAVTHVGYRRFEGGLVRVATASGRTSRYTPDHICIAMLGEPTDGNHIVYLMQRGQSFRIGRTPWRMSSQDNRLGPVHRALSQGASAVWILSAHATDYDAALAEALAQYRYWIPGWQFRSRNEFMPLAEFWSEAGDLEALAKMCLEAHGRDIRYPLWQNDGRHYQRRPIEIRACNLMSGRVCEVDLARPDSKGHIVTGGWTGAWQPATVTREPYDGMVYSIEVEREHTYIADGIVTHNCWHLDGPRISADYILFDEAQDANPVLVDIIRQQEHAQLVWVGDSQQQIYSFTGAENALKTVGAEQTAMLTKSFRFGPEIADVANRCLEGLNAPLRLTGTDTIQSRVVNDTIQIGGSRVILSRTNAAAVRELLATMRAGLTGHLVGGGRDVLDFAKAARQLEEENFTSHPELACFQSWAEVQTYVEQDEQGDDLSLLVKLIDDFGVEQIIDALEHMPSEEQAHVILSTAHKAKGREWDSVKLAADFPADPRDEELRLLYVACTRAKSRLDISAIDYLTEGKEPAIELGDHPADSDATHHGSPPPGMSGSNLIEMTAEAHSEKTKRDAATIAAGRSMTGPEAEAAILRTLDPPPAAAANAELTLTFQECAALADYAYVHELPDYTLTRVNGILYVNRHGDGQTYQLSPATTTHA